MPKYMFRIRTSGNDIEEAIDTIHNFIGNRAESKEFIKLYTMSMPNNKDLKIKKIELCKGECKHAD